MRRTIRMVSGPATPATALLWILAGCAEAPLPAADILVRDSAGVRILEVPPGAEVPEPVVLAVDPGWTPGITLEMGELMDVDLLPDGRVVLLDRMAGQIHLVPNGGGEGVVVGGLGDGPGEFSQGGMQRVVVTDSSFLVADLQLQRLTEFSHQGEVTDLRPYSGGVAYAIDWRAHPQGGVVHRVLDPGGDILVREHGNVVDTLFTFPAYHDPVNTLLGRIALWDVDPLGGVVVGISDVMQATARAAGEEPPAWITRWRGDPDGGEPGRPLSEVDRAHLEGVLMDALRQDPWEPSPEQLDRMLASINYPDRIPALAAVHVAPDGGIWLRRARRVEDMGVELLRVADAEGFGGEEWEVLSPEGAPLRRVHFPPGFAPRRFHRDWILGSLTDPMGVQRAARVAVPGG